MLERLDHGALSLAVGAPVLAYAACFTKDLLGGGLLMSRTLALLDKAADELEHGNQP